MQNIAYLITIKLSNDEKNFEIDSLVTAVFNTNNLNLPLYIKYRFQIDSMFYIYYDNIPNNGQVWKGLYHTLNRK